MTMSVVYTKVNGQILSESRGGTVSHFVPDPLGSVVMVRDTSGNTVYEAEYDPFGNIQSETGTNPSLLGFVVNLGCQRLGNWLAQITRSPASFPSLPS